MEIVSLGALLPFAGRPSAGPVAISRRLGFRYLSLRLRSPSTCHQCHPQDHSSQHDCMCRRLQAYILMRTQVHCMGCLRCCIANHSLQLVPSANAAVSQIEQLELSDHEQGHVPLIHHLGSAVTCECSLPPEKEEQKVDRLLGEAPHGRQDAVSNLSPKSNALADQNSD